MRRACALPREVHVAEEFLTREGVEEGTMFGFACLRLRGEFVAMPGNSFGGVVE